MVFVGCQKDDGVEPQKEDAMLSNRTVFGKYKLKPKKRLKGILGDETYLTTGVAYEAGNPSVQYKTLKITRPNGRFFYIMIENLRTREYGKAYGNDESNVAKYGRLYTYEGARNLQRSVYMKIPKISQSTGDPVGPNRNIRGRLPNTQDIKDLLETTNEIYGFDNEMTLDDIADNADNLYFDAFLAGLEDAAANSAAAEPSLGGHYYPNFVPQPGSEGPFTGLKIFGSFWLDGLSGGYPGYSAQGCFGIIRDIYPNIFYLSTSLMDEANYISVRYVFYPKYTK